MAARLIYDLAALDLSRTEIPIEEIRKINQQRFDMEQLSGIFTIDRQNKFIIGYKDVSDSEFWVKGHVPGRPIFPGVLIIEAAAQLCTYFYKIALNDDPRRFLGFGGLDKVKFRGTVLPGDRLILIAKNTELKSRIAIFETQGVVKGKVVFEGIITGMPI
ncbi:MAG: 3-hydroxyacyl-ACP dehydratase FabZ family protein [Candidatus Eremiobacteraeota bacterium]|nr:3-hydroxyacyl-ACP dehydratase FabZ family protein [Candidatus Eremiobacteraeota bacterium]